jgi:glycosidase
MKKRNRILLLLITILSVTLYGCNNEKTDKANNSISSEYVDSNEVEDSSSVTDNKANTENNDNKENSDIKDNNVGTVATVPYEYEQDLNILEDNYRNYYEIFVSSFCDSNNDGRGDINGIISKLDYIKDDMGFNGIWLMPIMPSPSYHKYDVTNYYDIDPNYGTLADFQKLVDECDKRGIKLIIDFVFNHTSAKHPWFTAAVDYLETLKEGDEPDISVCPSVEYYHFTKDYKGSKDYHKAGSSDWYYECVFWDQMPDLALESVALRSEIEKIAKFWLDLGVDGFRLDAAKEFYSGETSKNVEVLQWFSDYVRSVKEDAYIVGEVWDESDSIASYYKSGVTSFFDFPLALYDGLITTTTRKLGRSSAQSFANTLVSLQKKYSENNPEFIDAPFISNHDTTRVSAQCVNDENQMKMAAGLLLTMNGSPFVYYGEEIGMNSKGDKDENKRLPMQWSTTDNTGMTKAPTGADKVEQKFEPMDIQIQDSNSILNYYKRAIRIRNENPEMARGEMSVIEDLTKDEVCAVQKTYEGSQIVIIYNINTVAAKVDLKAAGYENRNIRGYLTVDGSTVTLTEGVLDMPMYSIVVLK